MSGNKEFQNIKIKTIKGPGSQWGELIIPDKSVNPEKNDKGLRVLGFGSTYPGYLIIEALKRFEKKYPEKINIVGFATDDATNSEAKISVKKRIWRLYSEKEKNELVNKVKYSALSFGIPCYTGEVKNEFFRELLKEWNPELIIVCGLGQKLDKTIINYPVFGIYNNHPSDLRKFIGTGAQPYEGTMEQGDTETRLTIHQVSEEIDEGKIVGMSPPINILAENGNYPEDIRKLHDKVTSVCGWMALDIINEALKRKQQGQISPINSLDFESGFHREIRNKLMEPVFENSKKRFFIDETTNRHT